MCVVQFRGLVDSLGSASLRAGDGGLVRGVLACGFYPLVGRLLPVKAKQGGPRGKATILTAKDEKVCIGLCNAGCLMLCCVVPCCVALCCAVLCFMLCCVLLTQVQPTSVQWLAQQPTRSCTLCHDWRKLSDSLAGWSLSNHSFHSSG